MPVTNPTTEKTKNGFIKSFITFQPIVCGRCNAPATHGAALVDSRTEWPENTYPMYTAKLLCRLHALQDYYTWPALESTERIELGRTKITIADREQ